MSEPEKRSYHDLEIETDKIPKTSIFDLPWGVSVTCCRVAGWELWQHHMTSGAKLLAGEFSSNWLRLYVGETVIVDSEPEANS